MEPDKIPAEADQTLKDIAELLSTYEGRGYKHGRMMDLLMSAIVSYVVNRAQSDETARSMLLGAGTVMLAAYDATMAKMNGGASA